MNAVNCLGTWWRIHFCYQEWTMLCCACTSNSHVRPKTRRILRLLWHNFISLHYWETFSLQVTGWKLDSRTTQTLPCDRKEQNNTNTSLRQQGTEQHKHFPVTERNRTTQTLPCDSKEQNNTNTSLRQQGTDLLSLHYQCVLKDPYTFFITRKSYMRAAVRGLNCKPFLHITEFE
jgi:hypothetical protein